jgi:hypothetical protein
MQQKMREVYRTQAEDDEDDPYVTHGGGCQQ